MLKLLHKPAGAAILAAVLMAACGGGGGAADVPLWLSPDVKLADIDGDGRLDVVTLSYLVEPYPAPDHGQVTVWRQAANGLFSASQSYPVGFTPWQLAIADMDGDGAPDLVISDVGSRPATIGGVWMLRQEPSRRGTFGAAQRLVELPKQPYHLVVGDVNGDGVPDVVATTSPSGWSGATVLLQDQGHRGTFLPPLSLELPGAQVADLALGDLDGDGRNDMVFRVYRSSAGIDSSAVGVRHGQADGTLGPWVELPSPAQDLNSDLLAIADVNGDGRPDILEKLSPCCASAEPEVIALLQRQDGGFSRVPTSLSGLPGQGGQAFADLDGDGRPDFVTAGFYPVGAGPLRPPQIEARLHVLRQDGSGAFLVTQTVGLEFADKVAAGDVNGDGLNDLVVFDYRDGRPALQVLLQLPASRGVFVLGQTIN
jgi:hypothetical protein